MERAAGLAGLTIVALGIAGLVGIARDPDATSADPPRDGDPIQVQAAGLGLVPFGACEPLVDHLRAAVARDPWGMGGMHAREESFAFADGDAPAADTAAAAPQASRLSGTSDTNVQVAGVDEPDLTETDGRRLFTVAQGVLQVLDVSGPRPSIVSSTRLEGGDDGGEAQLVLHDDRLLVVQQRWDARILPMGDAVASDLVDPGASVTTLLLYDVARDDPSLVGRLDMDGQYVAGRGIDGTAHLVLAHRPTPLPMAAMDAVWQAESEAEARTRMAAALANTTTEDWLPRLAHQSADGIITTAPALGCTDIARTVEEPGSGTLQVVTLDMHGADAMPEDTTGVLTDAQTVTASADQLVVATTVWDEEPMTPLHLFDLDPAGATYLASGTAPGTLLNQFSMSLHDGHLRVATTAGDSWMGDSESGVTVLRRHGDRLEAVGQVGGMGRGETIHSVRFLGDRGYVVTFRQTDPLYSLDLSDPTDPKVTGELKITGYSAYLHPLSGDRLLGIGQEATLEGQTTGTQVSVFDVSDPSEPRRLSQVQLPGASSEGEWDHHAVLVHDDTLVLPFERWSAIEGGAADWQEQYEAGAIVVDLADQLDVRGTLQGAAGNTEEAWLHGIRRAVVVDGRILTVSHAGVNAWDGASLERTGAVSW